MHFKNSVENVLFSINNIYNFLVISVLTLTFYTLNTSHEMLYIFFAYTYILYRLPSLHVCNFCEIRKWLSYPQFPVTSELPKCN